MALPLVSNAGIALALLLLAALISVNIKLEVSSAPSDPRKRRIWFWTLAGLTPLVGFLVAFFVLPPKNRVELDKFMNALPYGMLLGTALYIGIGFVMSRLVWPHGKIGHWFPKRR